MLSGTKKVLLVAGAFFSLGLIAWPGCATPPLPSSRKPILSRKTEDFRSLKTKPMNRSEVVARLGEPDVYYPGLRVACYRINEVTKRNLWLFLGVIPLNVEKTRGGFEVAFIKFDEQERVERFDVEIAPGRGLDAAAAKWAARK
jgi:hypothetical protein